MLAHIKDIKGLVDYEKEFESLEDLISWSNSLDYEIIISKTPQETQPSIFRFCENFVESKIDFVITIYNGYIE